MDAQRVDDKPNFSHMGDFSGVDFRGCGVGYVLSCLYVLSISATFDFPVSDYLDFIDYVQFFPQSWGNILILALVFLVFVYS
jgi:hypothetical protein